MGSFSTSPVVSLEKKLQFTISASSIDNAIVGLLSELVKSEVTAHMDITVQLIEGIKTTWNVCIDKRFLTVSVPAGPLAEGSKQSLITLMELAESVGCVRCVVGFAKERKDKALLMKTFLFLGFAPMPPAEWPSCKPPASQFFMAYNVE